MNGIVEVIKSDHTAWGFTYKKLGTGKWTEDDYVPALSTLARKGKVQSNHFEKDSKGVLHCHGVVILKKGLFRKMLCPQGFHSKFVEIYDREGWDRYCMKDQPGCELNDQAAHDKINNTVYMFDD